jgi:cullin-associated NEDD8-dissociated protein 1
MRFIKGYYEGFGSGNYGDLASTIAATLMYRDAVSPTLKSDASHGKIREPILKVFHLLRALELSTKSNGLAVVQNLKAILGQEPFYAPSVFNFYVSEAKPAGAVANSGLVAPEGQILYAQRVVDYLNAVITMVELGSTNCFTTFGVSSIRVSNCTKLQLREENSNLTNFGQLNHASILSGLDAAGVVDRLDLLLTGGRLDENRRLSLIQTYRSISSSLSIAEAQNTLVELFTAIPEYQVSLLQLLITEED